MEDQKQMRRWTWLFPLTYILHASEELFAGEHFYTWLSRVSGADLSRADFLTINAVALIAMTAAVMAINSAPAARWITATLGFIVCFNGSLHVISSIVTQSYSPGTVSGALVWLPLGIYALRRCRRELPPAELRRGIIVGVVMHALVMTIALNA